MSIRMAILIGSIAASPGMLFCQPTDLPDVKKPDPLPAAARQSIERYDKAVAEAKKAYDAAVAKAADAARKDLAKIQESETKAGRLEPALAVKAQVDKLPDPAAPASNIPKYYLDLAEKITAGTWNEAEWSALPGKEIKVMADSPKTETKITVKKGEVYLIAPNPADKWYGGPTPTTYFGNGPWLKLRVMINEVSVGFLAEGEGPLVLSPYHTTYVGNVGFVRVKIIKVR